ncbi:protein SMG9-like, partial [Passer montanus]|uniref:protein SMG9-like n=1 Tax=Passer montanus TaxID=9160 RepID=UPI0019605758
MTNERPGRGRGYTGWAWLCVSVVGVASLTSPRPQEQGEEPAGPLQKTPIILAKPPAERQAPPAAPKAGPVQAPPPPAPAPPIVLMKARGEEGRGGGVASAAAG